MHQLNEAEAKGDAKSEAKCEAECKAKFRLRVMPSLRLRVSVPQAAVQFKP